MDPLAKPTPDHVRVLAVLPKKGRQWLSTAARALLDPTSRDFRAWDEMDDRNWDLPSEFAFDRSFCSLALGSWSPRKFDFGSDKTVRGSDLDPNKSDYFVIRGYVRPNGQGLPHTLGDLEIYSDPRTCTSLTCGLDPAVGSIVDVQTKLDMARLTANNLDGSGVAVAIVDSGIFLQHLTGINLLTRSPERTRPLPRFPLMPRKAGDPPVLDEVNSWKPPSVATPAGGHRIDHGTMCAYNVLAIAPKATLLDHPALIARAAGDHSVNATIGAAQQAYAALIDFWLANRAQGASAPYHALVVNNSWGIFHPCEEDFPPGHPGRFIDNPYHPMHMFVWFLTTLGADVVFAAGNGGSPCPTPPFLHLTTGSIRGANAYSEVLTVAGCDVNDSRVGYSSQGPAVMMFPLPTPNKPDLTAYTHFLGSQVFGEREPDRGTSTACPVAAGCVAALRTKFPAFGVSGAATISPAAMFEALKNSARSVGGPGWNKDFGHGIIDPIAAGRHLGLSIP